MLATYEPVSCTAVETDTKATAAVVGRGDVSVNLNVNAQCVPCTLKDVLHVPDFEYSLFAVSRMSQNGLRVAFEGSRCVTRSRQTAVGAASPMGRLYVLDMYNKSVSAHAATLQIWHERFAHVSKQGILSMQRKHVVSGVGLSHTWRSNSASKARSDTRLDRNVCLASVSEKATRAVAPRARSTPRSACPLDSVHSDVCGSMQVQSVGGARHFVSFVDDCTSWVSVHMLRTKSEAFSKYILLKSRAELHTGRRVRVLRTDRGGEYLSSEFIASLEADGTQHQLTTAHGPHQNGVAERLNRTPMDLVRAMLAGKRLCKRFWAEALAAAVHVRSRVTSKALKSDTTPYQLCWKMGEGYKENGEERDDRLRK